MSPCAPTHPPPPLWQKVQPWSHALAAVIGSVAAGGEWDRSALVLPHPMGADAPAAAAMRVPAPSRAPPSLRWVQPAPHMPFAQPCGPPLSS